LEKFIPLSHRTRSERASPPHLAETRYFIEEECGGSDAAGGGCGAPLCFYEVPEVYCTELVGRKYNRPQSHRRDELPKSAFDLDGNMVSMVVALKLRPCLSCRLS